MQTEKNKLRAEQIMALNTYKHERKKIADTFFTGMQKQTQRDNIISCAIGGAALGAVFIILVAGTIARDLSYNPKTHKTETRFNKNVFTQSTLRIIAACVLGCLGAFGVKTAKSKKQNRITSIKMANDILKKYFDKTLAPLSTENMPLRAATATALIMNNMHEHDINKLRTLATDSMFTDNNGNHVLYDDCINIASQIISDYMRTKNSKNEHEDDTDRADLEMMLNHQIETINIPDYYLRMLRLPSDKRSLINDGVSHLNNNGEITIHMGKNFEPLLSYLCSEQQCTLYEIIHGFFNNIIMKIEIGHDSFSRVSTSWINKIQNMKDSISFQDKNMLVASYFCANNFISPSFIEKGYGTIYMFYENASNTIQTTEEQFQECLLRKYNDGKKKIEKNIIINIIILNSLIDLP